MRLRTRRARRSSSSSAMRLPSSRRALIDAPGNAATLSMSFRARSNAVVGFRAGTRSITMTDITTELEAAAFRRLLEHLDARADVQNIDLMILAGFCRNCLADWYREAGEQRGHSISKEAARERIYGQP